MKHHPVYLDHASTTPIDHRVLSAMMPYFTDDFANASNLYGSGRLAKEAIITASKQIAEALHCRMDEFVFTGSATEADNLAIAGVARANKTNDSSSGSGGSKGGRIIISSVEHKGIVAVCEALEKEGFEIVKIPVGKDGVIDLEEFKAALNEKTILVSVTMADSETGTLQPIQEIVEIIKEFRIRGGHKPGDFSNNLTSSLPYFHTDATQAAVYSSIDVQKLGIDLLTLSAHKLRGPKGIGGLFVRRGVKINPIIYGGGQQSRLRSGTENVPAIVGFGKAMELNEFNKKKSSVRVKKLRDALQKGIFRSVKKVVLNGHQTKRLPNFLNISILDVEGEALLLYLDEFGIMVNTGSACNSESLNPSAVLTAIGNPYEFIHGSLRFTLGMETSMSDIDHVLKHLPKIVESLRKISPLDLSLDEKKVVSDPRAFVGGKTPHFLKSKLKLR